MNINNYNYYGDYNNKNDNNYTTSVYEIQKKQIERDRRRTKVFRKILSKCYRRIKLASENEEYFCFFQLPEYISGTPIYNMTECVLYMLDHLSKNGFYSKYCSHYLLFITWPLKNKSPKMIENKEQPPKNITEKLNLNYRSINDYKPSGNFLYNNKRF